MELKTARLTLLIDPNKKAALEHLCAQQDLTASQVVRQLIRDYLLAHGVGYTPSGEDSTEPQPAPTAGNKAPKAGRAKAKKTAPSAARQPRRSARPAAAAPLAKTRRRT